jgi:hypothetical protein
MREKFVIVDIHPEDSFYDARDELLGLVLELDDDDWHDSFVENDPLLKEGRKYMAGGATLEKRLEILNNGNYIYFYAVMVAPLSEVENS